MGGPAEPRRKKPVLLRTYFFVKPGEVLSPGAAIYCKHVHYYYHSGTNYQFSIVAKPGLGWYGQGNCASAGYAINIVTRLGRNNERKLFRRKDRAGDGKRCGPVKVGERPVWENWQYATPREK